MNKRRIYTIGAIIVLVVAISATSLVYGFDEIAEASSLANGSRGEVVEKLQKALKNEGFYNGSIDGVYGDGTISAVKNFQKAKGLGADGIAGAKTLKLLGIDPKEVNGENGSGTGSYTESDVYLLAKAIYAEARGESYIGKVAVGAVVLNRVKSAEFPNTISGVIYQPWAFTAVFDGQISMEPDDECLRAARDAINGWDPTYGCIYYYNPSTATSSWIYNTEKVIQIGKHVFSI